MNSDRTFKFAVAALVVLSLMFARRMLHPALAADGTDARWDAAMRNSLASGKPTILLFTADWCPACRALHSSVLSRDDVEREISEHYNFHTVDLTNPTQAEAQHAQQFGAKYIPLMIRYDAQGKETGRGNFHDAPMLIEWLRAGE